MFGVWKVIWLHETLAPVIPSGLVGRNFAAVTRIRTEATTAMFYSRYTGVR